jgi:hypothetical protein
MMARRLEREADQIEAPMNREVREISDDDGEESVA